MMVMVVMMMMMIIWCVWVSEDNGPDKRVERDKVSEVVHKHTNVEFAIELCHLSLMLLFS